MSKFYLMMLRDKEANGAHYAFPHELVSERLDPKLKTKLLTKFQFSSVEDAEANAKEIAKQLFIYDHTKRPRVLKDFRLYRFWILDALKPVECGKHFEPAHDGFCANYVHEIATLASQLSSGSNWIAGLPGTKHAIVKRVKIDFSKEKDPSNGAIAKRAKEENERIEAKLRDQRAYVCTYDDEPGTFDDKYALDLIPSSSVHIKNFHRDSLNLSTEYCFIYPTKGCYYGDSTAQRIGIDRSSRKKVWACSVSRCCYEKEAHWKDYCSEMYKASISVFATKEEAILHAALLGFPQPQIFDDFKLPSYVERLLRFIKGVGGTRVYPAEVYRCMVLDGVMQPIKKFMKKKNNKKVA